MRLILRFLKLSSLRKSVLSAVFFSLCLQSYAQNSGESVILTMSDIGAYSIVERSDWRRYDNGKYSGLVRNEVRASIIPLSARSDAALPNNGNSNFYQGNFYVIQSTLRDMRHSAQAVDDIIPVSFEVTKSGSVKIDDDRGYPMMRGFPSFSSQEVTRGVKWRAPGNRAVDPFNKGQAVVIPFTAEYEYRGMEHFSGTLVHRIYAVYGYNYRNIIASHPYARVMGNHKVDILIRAADGLPVFMRDELTDTYTLEDGSIIELKGFTLTFNSSIIPLDKDKVITDIEDTLNIDTPDIPVPPPGIDPADLKDIDLTPIPEGIKLTIKNIQFIADSSQFLPSEIPRLDLMALALKQIPGRTFLVEGHTASTGQPDNEMRLSIDRAVSIINELVKRGISANRFIYKGWGGTRPVGDNMTDSGRSANRRVEITILE